MPHASSRIISRRAAIKISLPQGQSLPVWGLARAGAFVGLGAGFCALDGFKGSNASHDRVSGLTCIPYFTPACTALVQLKNFSPGFGLKLAQLPQILLLIFCHLLQTIVPRDIRFVASRFDYKLLLGNSKENWAKKRVND